MGCWRWVGMLLVCLACHGQGWVQQGNKLVAATDQKYQQGTSAALSADGNTAIVGAPFYGAFVYTRTGGTWSNQTLLVGSGSAKNSQQGWAVALSSDGNTAAVTGEVDNFRAGAVWVFTRASGKWTEQAKLVGTGAIGAAGQGWSVALSADGNTLLEGGPFDNGAVGAAWVFTRLSGAWTQQAELSGTGYVPPGATQGWSAALSADGNTAILGGQNDGGTDNGSNGAAWVFTRAGGTWTQQGNKLTASGMGGAAGTSVAISGDGNTVLLGAPLDSAARGAAWVFTRSGAVWTQQFELVGSGSVGQSYQGQSVALSGDGNTAMVGGYQDNFPGQEFGTGATWAFTRSGTTWSQVGSKLVGTGAATAEQGAAVALSSDGYTALIGGPFDNFQVGAAWVFVYGTATQTTLTLPVSPVAYGSLTMTATVKSTASGSVAPTRTVTFQNAVPGTAPVTLGTAALDSTGTAALKVSTLAVGTYSNLEAAYGGDANYFGSVSTPDQLLTVQKAATSVQMPVVSGSPTVGQTLTFSATITSTGGVPSGTVTFSDGGASIGSGGVNAAGTATITTSSLSLGSHSITATYNGDANFAASAPSSALAVTIGTAVTLAGATVTGSPSVVVYGQTVTLTATFTGTFTVGTASTATLVDGNSGTVLCTAPFTNGVAACNIAAALSVGIHTVTVGSLNVPTYSLGPVVPFSLTVNKATTTVGVSGPATVQTGQISTFRARVSVIAPGLATLTGTLSFTTNSVSVAACQNLALSSGLAECDIAITATTNTIGATYSGDANTLASSGLTVVAVPSTGITAILNSGSYAASNAAADEIVVLYGINMTASQSDPAVVTIADSAGAKSTAQVLYASPTQINCILPAGLASGTATITVTSAAGTISAAFTIGTVSPGLFSANASGAGVAAANVVRILADGTLAPSMNAAVYDSTRNAFVAAPIDLSTPGDLVYIVLYGTGIRHNSGLAGTSVTVNGAAVPVAYADLTPGYAGLDQVNLGPLPASLKGTGEVAVKLTVDGQAANPVTLTFR